VSLVERLAAPPADPAKQFCTVGKLIKQVGAGCEIDDDALAEKQALVAALSDPAWSSTALHRELQAEGWYFVSVRHIREHRNGHTATVCANHDIGVTP